MSPFSNAIFSFRSAIQWWRPVKSLLFTTQFWVLVQTYLRLIEVSLQQIYLNYASKELHQYSYRMCFRTSGPKTKIGCGVSKTGPNGNEAKAFPQNYGHHAP